jgi:hypothetical protein
MIPGVFRECLRCPLPSRWNRVAVASQGFILGAGCAVDFAVFGRPAEDLAIQVPGALGLDLGQHLGPLESAVAPSQFPADLSRTYHFGICRQTIESLPRLQRRGSGNQSSSLLVHPVGATQFLALLVALRKLQQLLCTLLVQYRGVLGLPPLPSHMGGDCPLRRWDIGIFRLDLVIVLERLQHLVGWQRVRVRCMGRAIGASGAWGPA